MTTVLPVSLRTAPLPPPLTAYAARGSSGRTVVLVAPGVAEADQVVLLWSLAEEIERTGRDRAWRVSVQ